MFHPKRRSCRTLSAIAAIGTLITILAICACVAGWGLNLYKAVQMVQEKPIPVTGLVIRGAGIAVPPIGVVTGYLDIEGDPPKN